MRILGKPTRKSIHRCEHCSALNRRFFVRQDPDRIDRFQCLRCSKMTTMSKKSFVNGGKIKSSDTVYDQPILTRPFTVPRMKPLFTAPEYRPPEIGHHQIIWAIVKIEPYYPEEPNPNYIWDDLKITRDISHFFGSDKLFPEYRASHLVESMKEISPHAMIFYIDTRKTCIDDIVYNEADKIRDSARIISENYKRRKI